MYEIYNCVPLECPKWYMLIVMVLYHVLPNLTSDVVLGVDWLHAINPWIDWNTYLLSLDYEGHIVRILGTE